MSAFGGKADIVEFTPCANGGYLSLDVWPARQARNAAAACSRSSALLSRRRGCLLTGAVTMGVPPLKSSTPCRRIRRRCCIRDQFVRPLMTPIDCNHHSKAAGTAWKNRRLCLSAPDEEHAKGQHRRGCRTWE